MARIRVARGSKNNLPGALDENALLYGEMYWEREQTDDSGDGVSKGVLYMGQPDGEGSTQDPMAIAGARAMQSLYFQGLWDPSGGAYPADAQIGDIYVAQADGGGAASTFKYGDWAVCIDVSEDGTSSWLKAINQAITTEDPLGHDRNPLQLNEGVLKLKYDPATLRINDNGELTVSHVEVYTVESSVSIPEGTPVALDNTGKAIIADAQSVDTAVVIGVASQAANPGEFVTVQRADLVQSSTYAFTEIGGPVYLYLSGAYTQDVENIQPGMVLQQVGIATATDTIDVHIGTPFQLDASSDIYYIPLTQEITETDTTHAPSSAAVFDLMQQLTNVDDQLVSKTKTGTQQIAGSLELAGDLTARDIFVEANSLYIGDAKLSSSNGVLQVTNNADQTPTPIEIITADDLLSLPQNIIPITTNTHDLGSPTKRWANLYAEEVHVGASSLYVNGKKVIEDVSNTIEFKTSQDQSLTIKTDASTPGNGNANIVLQSGNEINTIGYGGIEFSVPVDAANKNITFTNASSGGNISFSGDTTFVDNVAISGDLTVSGTVTSINTTQVNISDNLIQINSNQTGVPATSLIGGIEINRGDESNYRFVFEELTDTFRIGEQSSLQAVATRKDNMGIDGNVPTWNTTLHQFQNTTVTISGSTITGTLNGNASTASALASAATITLNGDVSGSVDFDGSSNVTLTATVANNSHTHTSANISDATSGSTANTIVKRDSNGDFSAGTITANLAGRANTATSTDEVRGVNFHADDVDPSGNTRLNMDGDFHASRVYNAVWNDIADFIPVPKHTTIQYGRAYVMDENGEYAVSQSYCPEGLIGIVSDTYGIGVGRVERQSQMPIAIGGFVLAYVDKVYRTGTPLTAGPGGILTEISSQDKRDYPERILATFWKDESEMEWNGINVDGRRWVKIR